MPRFTLPARLRPHRLLLWTLGLSLLIHLSLLTFRLAAPQAYQRVFQDTPLEVTLVNAHSTDSPEQAQALAQKRLAGGGEIPQVVLSTSPLPPQPSEESGSDMSATQRQIETLKMQQMMLLSVLRQELAELQKQEVGDSPRGAREGAQEQRKRQLSQQLAAIEQRVQATQGAARKRYISPATEETPYAVYYDKLRRTIELKGTQHFPDPHLSRVAMPLPACGSNAGRLWPMASWIQHLRCAVNDSGRKKSRSPPTSPCITMRSVVRWTLQA